MRAEDNLANAINTLRVLTPPTTTPEPIVPFTCDYLPTWMLQYYEYLFEYYSDYGYYSVRYEYPYYYIYQSKVAQFKEELGCDEDYETRKRRMVEWFSGYNCENLESGIAEKFQNVLEQLPEKGSKLYNSLVSSIYNILDCPTYHTQTKRSHEATLPFPQRRTHFFLTDAEYRLDQAINLNSYEPISICGTYQNGDQLQRPVILATPPEDLKDEALIHAVETSISFNNVYLTGAEFKSGQSLLSVGLYLRLCG